jgi:hypothetical protein
MGHGRRARILHCQIVGRFFQHAGQLKHQGSRINLNQACIISHEAADKGLPRQARPIATLQCLDLPCAKLECLGDVTDLQPPRLACQTKLLANRHFLSNDAIVSDCVFDIDLLTHSKLPFRNS